MLASRRISQISQLSDRGLVSLALSLDAAAVSCSGGRTESKGRRCEKRCVRDAAQREPADVSNTECKQAKFGQELNRGSKVSKRPGRREDAERKRKRTQGSAKSGAACQIWKSQAGNERRPATAHQWQHPKIPLPSGRMCLGHSNSGQSATTDASIKKVTAEVGWMGFSRRCGPGP